MKKILIAASCVMIFGCSHESDDVPPDLTRKDNLELRVIDFILIDPKTGLPPMGAGFVMRGPQGEYPSMGILPEDEDERFRFHIIWIAEKDAEPNITVRVDGFEETVIGLDKVKRCRSHLSNTRLPLQEIMLIPLEGEQAAPSNC